MDFFEEPQGAAVFKHGMFRRYVPQFAGKLGKRAPGGRVVVCDGYAGPGRYEDDTPGSPLIAAEIAANTPRRKIEVICVEKDPENAAQLQEELALFKGNHCVLTGAFDEHVDEVLEFAGDSPLLAFLDPFGMGVPMEKLRDLLDRDRQMGVRVGYPTEVLMNFSFSGLRRNGGHLKSDSTGPTYLKARETILRKMDAWMGGEWWRDVWMRAGDSEEERQAVLREIVYEYLDRTARERSWHICPAADRWDGPPIYLLALFTQSPHGLWAFNEALSKAREDFYKYAHRDQLELDPFPGWAEEWKTAIATNLKALLREGPVRVGEHGVGHVLGDTLGWAREKHIRAAIKKLYREGETSTDGRGDVYGMVVRPP